MQEFLSSSCGQADTQRCSVCKLFLRRFVLSNSRVHIIFNSYHTSCGQRDCVCTNNNRFTNQRVNPNAWSWLRYFRYGIDLLNIYFFSFCSLFLFTNQPVAKNPTLHQHSVRVGAQRLFAVGAGRVQHIVAEEHHHRHGAVLAVPVVRGVRRHGRVPTLRGAHVRRMQR